MIVKVRDCPTSRAPIYICYQCFGNPDDGLPAVLLIGGLNMQLSAWDEAFCESLVRAGFYVIRYDNRDIGHSTKIENCGKIKVPMLLLPGRAAKWLGEELPYQLEDMAEDAWALLDALSIPCAHLFGVSMGGMIAQRAALQAPERTMSLTSVMSSTNAPDLPEPALWVKLWMLRPPPRNCTVDELLEFRVHSLRHLLRYALPPDGEYLKKRFLMSLRRSSYASGLVRQAAAIRRAAGCDALLQQLHVPALIVHGAQDVVVPPMNGYRTAAMLPYARLLVLKSMGHYFHPAFFSTVIAAFVDMAASTDPARRCLRSALPSATGDDGRSGNSRGRLGGASEVGAGDDGDEPSGSSDDKVVLTSRMMASLGEFIVPVVADADSPIGKAACRSVMVAVPGGNSNPAVPEAVMVENLFQRDPYATLSVPKSAIVKQPVPWPPLKSEKHLAASRVSTGDGPAISSSGNIYRKEEPSASPNAVTLPTASVAAVAPSSSTAELRTFPLLSHMEGVKPFVPCSSSRWHELVPYPQRSAAAAGGAGIRGIVRGGRPSVGKMATECPGSSSSASSSVAALGVGVSTCPSGDGAEPAKAPSRQQLPRFHPVVVGIPVEEYLRKNPTSQQSRIRAPATAAGSTAVSEAGKANVGATPSATPEGVTGVLLDGIFVAFPLEPAVAASAGSTGSVKTAHDGTTHLSLASRIESAGREADETFLHSEASQDFHDASSFADM
ncbi:esterase-like protein [Leishmania guyanensis]